VHSLSTQGFTTFPISDRPSLHDAASALFNLSRAFFAQPQPEKEAFGIQDANVQGSEEGWSRVVGEKELLTLRRLGNTCPPSIEETGKKLWHECGQLMQEMTRAIEISLAMNPGALNGIVGPECELPTEQRVETLLRMFRYERRDEGVDNESARVAESSVNGTKQVNESLIGKGRLVAEPHRDLGILSLVIGSSPGLEVVDGTIGGWIPVETPPYAHPASSTSNLTATILVGETLTHLTNGRYAPGRHRVFVPSVSPEASNLPPKDDSHFRFSLVFALRPHGPAVISTQALTTCVTGAFARPMEGIPAKKLFDAIAKSHWNINTGQAQRQRQRQKLEGGGKHKGRQGETEGSSNVASTAVRNSYVL